MPIVRARLAACLLLLALAGCRADRDAPPPPPRPAALPPTPWKAAAVAHGGVGSPPDRSGGCRAAVDAALAVLDRGGDPVDAAVAGVVVLEDDARFNAGTGSRVRIDGRTVQMDASVMDSSGRFAAVAAIEAVKNPVLVARAVLDTPHLLLAGDGATRFARTLGMPPYDPATDEMRAKTEAIREQLRRNDPALPDRWRTFDWRARWNFETPLAEAGLAPAPPAPEAGVRDAGADTVGVAVRATDGRFAVALSTGGTAITLRGRVGDVPIYGAGLFAGPRGASAATGTGERIIEAALAREVDAWLSAGATPDEAARRAVEVVQKKKGDIGIIVIGPDAIAAGASEPMAWAGRESGSGAWQGPAPGASAGADAGADASP
jgi:isoaspartyl peptidase/L-asparaginase-like protein (Ntn-hydrolase superfamily)